MMSYYNMKLYSTKFGKDQIAKDETEAAAMESAKQFLSETKEVVDELKDYQEWMPKVMQSERPVILDCYAE